MPAGTFALHDRIIGGGLAELLRTQRAQGLPWNEIAYRLRQEHDLKVSVETLRRWYAELEPSPDEDRAAS